MSSRHVLVGELAIPGKDGIRPGHGGDFFERLLTQLDAQLGEFLALAVGQLQATVDLIAQDAIFCHDVFHGLCYGLYRAAIQAQAGSRIDAQTALIDSFT